MTQIEIEQTERTTLRAPGRLPHPTYWLIAKNENGRMEVLTFCRDGEEMLPVFSFEEEAEMFLRFRDVDDAWRVRESGAGELVSVLYGRCAGVKEVALDPLPEMVVERTIGLVCLVRERFIGHIIEHIATGERYLGLSEPGGW